VPSARVRCTWRRASRAQERKQLRAGSWRPLANGRCTPPPSLSSSPRSKSQIPVRPPPTCSSDSPLTRVPGQIKKEDNIILSHAPCDAGGSNISFERTVPVQVALRSSDTKFAPSSISHSFIHPTVRSIHLSIRTCGGACVAVAHRYRRIDKSSVREILGKIPPADCESSPVHFLMGGSPGSSLRHMTLCSSVLTCARTLN
jgi:hypothetical protein